MNRLSSRFFHRCSWENERELGSKLGFERGIEIAQNRQFSWTMVKLIPQSSVVNLLMNDTMKLRYRVGFSDVILLARDQQPCSSPR